MGLVDDAAPNDLAILHGHLARNIEKAAGFHGTGERQVLATGTGFIRAITLDGHEALLEAK
ncbi:hypothetical protein D3C87_1805270 [compost metagenome]